MTSTPQPTYIYDFPVIDFAGLVITYHLLITSAFGIISLIFIWLYYKRNGLAKNELIGIAGMSIIDVIFSWMLFSRTLFDYIYFGENSSELVVMSYFILLILLLILPYFFGLLLGKVFSIKSKLVAVMSYVGFVFPLCWFLLMLVLGL